MNCRQRMIASLAMLLSTPAVTWGGWPFTSDGPRRGSEEYYEMRSGEPNGQRQTYRAGKLWPPHPRPVGDALPLAHRFHANHYWPYPYTTMEQADVNAFADIQVANGWQFSTTFFEYHFQPGTQTLNSAGETQLAWILAHVPLPYRQAYLASSADSGVNSQRLASVQRGVERLVGSTDSLPITLRVTTPIGRPASEIDAIFKERVASMDKPVIPFSAPSSGSSQ